MGGVWETYGGPTGVDPRLILHWGGAASGARDSEIMNRRRFLHHSIALLAAGSLPQWAQGQDRPSPFRLLDVLPFLDEGRNYIDVLYGQGLEGRLAFDISTLTKRRLITPQDKFFIRTRYPEQLSPDRPWSLSIDGMVEKPMTLDLGTLPSAVPLGTHLLECSGSTRNSSFGLMSAATWDGIPLASLIDGWKVDPRATHALVSGVDPLQGDNRGASWVFPLAALRHLGALATHMNGAPLSKDHGFPVRLMMPGWYGCCWIKWVDRIAFVDASVAATDHMREYAGRTLQSGIPRRASDFTPATIDAAAMPVRVEMWQGPEGLFYRVVGISWGGERLPTGLRIQYAPQPEVIQVSDFTPTRHQTWNLWSQVWRPKQPGEYTFLLDFADPGLPSRRMDQGYYRRRVRVPEV